MALFDVPIRGLVIFSFVAHILLVVFAGVRRRKATSICTVILWGANQVARWAPISALGKLSAGGTPQQEQLVTLWVAFMLLHAGMPDNITAYSLEDSVLAWRQKITVINQLMGPVSPASILIMNWFFISSGDTMILISSVVCIMAIFKYVEGADYALSRGNLENMRSLRNDEKKMCPGGRRNSLQIARRGGRKLDDEQILLVAHDMLYITKDAFIDYLGEKNGDADEQEALSSTWDEAVYKVVSMELSLMYDILYTKKTMVHTWGGYAIRFASPFVGSTAFLMFWFHSKQGQAMVDVLITYVLLASTVILDIKWLLRAVASTWTYSFLNDRPRLWLHHAVLCSGKWRLIRRIIISLNLFRLIANKKPSSYRMWSGTIGQYNLLRECTCDEKEKTTGYRSSVLKRIAPENMWMEYEYHNLRGTQISRHLKEPLFSRIWENMKLAFPKRDPPPLQVSSHPCPPPAAAPPAPPQYALDPHQDINNALDFTPDMQETILILHIATDIFLLSENSHKIQASAWVEAIRVLSNYMMFLVAVRPNLLPGLALSSRYEAVVGALGEKWKEEKSPSLAGSNAREKRLADMLLEAESKKGLAPVRYYEWLGGNKEIMEPGGFLSVLYDSSYILSEGTRLAGLLLNWETRSGYKGDESNLHKTLRKKFERLFPDLMKSEGEKDELPEDVTDAIFREWVRQLINVSIRCSRDSHAKQLGRGGELTTVVWILAEHARILRVKQTRDR
ncbi:uncharacterized protein LOC102711150 [Oryza brachyantha]|nr:uncharacterized protein LOC102711150 [Oryza brachyantha]AHW98498.1 hypothetical protein [Oryza brachyantha]